MSAFANAGESVYEVEVPSVESGPGGKGSHHLRPNPLNNGTAEGSAANPESSGGGETSEGEPEGEEATGGGSPSTGGGGNPPTGGGGETAGNGSKAGGGPEGSIGGNQKVAEAGSTDGATPETSESTTEGTDSGGSSPVVPILIAVVVLAAISIGVVLYRQRKSSRGPDGRVSSPKAS